MAQYANKIGYSDVNPYEVISKVSEKTLVVRAMNADLDENWKPECHVGGFFCNVSNNIDQKWVITSDPSQKEFRVRQHKDGMFYDKHGDKYQVGDTPIKFYDYNF